MSQRSDTKSWAARSKTWRRPYTKSKAFDSSCRCHGGCGYCLGNRMYSQRKAEPVDDRRNEKRNPHVS